MCVLMHIFFMTHGPMNDRMMVIVAYAYKSIAYGLNPEKY